MLILNILKGIVVISLTKCNLLENYISCDLKKKVCIDCLILSISFKMLWLKILNGNYCTKLKQFEWGIFNFQKYKEKQILSSAIILNFHFGGLRY